MFCPLGDCPLALYGAIKHAFDYSQMNSLGFSWVIFPVHAVIMTDVGYSFQHVLFAGSCKHTAGCSPHLSGMAKVIHLVHTSYKLARSYFFWLPEKVNSDIFLQSAAHWFFHVRAWLHFDCKYQRWPHFVRYVQYDLLNTGWYWQT